MNTESTFPLTQWAADVPYGCGRVELCVAGRHKARLTRGLADNDHCCLKLIITNLIKSYRYTI